MTDRTTCEHRHENGNCLPIGGFCAAVDDKYCLKEGGTRMTYEESYKKCQTFEELQAEIKSDIIIACFSPDRRKRIEQAAERVLKLRGWFEMLPKESEVQE